MAQLHISVEKNLIAENIRRRKMVTANPQTNAFANDVAVDDSFGPVRHVGMAEVSAWHRAFLVRKHDMTPDSRASILLYIAIHDDGAGPPQVDRMGVPGDVVILHRQVLDCEAVNNRFSANTRIKVDHAVMGRLRL